MVLVFNTSGQGLIPSWYRLRVFSSACTCRVPARAPAAAVDDKRKFLRLSEEEFMVISLMLVLYEKFSINKNKK